MVSSKKSSLFIRKFGYILGKWRVNVRFFWDLGLVTGDWLLEN
jgi:hypothetical protein